MRMAALRQCQISEDLVEDVLLVIFPCFGTDDQLKPNLVQAC